MRDIKIFENFLETNICLEWISKFSKINRSYELNAGELNEIQYDEFDKRVMDITNDPIVYRVKNFLEKKCKCKLQCNQAQMQIWPKGSNSQPHIHNHNGREDGDYNSLLYLNSNFGGGEFFIRRWFIEKKIKPQDGMLTFFDGSKLYHGVKKVKKCDRYTLIFWWKNTIFY